MMRMGTRRACAGLVVAVLLSACADAELMAPRAPVEEEALGVVINGVSYSCRPSSRVMDSGGVVCVAPYNEPVPIFLIGFISGVASGIVVAAVMDVLGSDPAWFRIAKRSCAAIARQEGWDNYNVDLIFNAVTGELVEWNCEEREY